jgi:hypothetical protein
MRTVACLGHVEGGRVDVTGRRGRRHRLWVWSIMGLGAYAGLKVVIAAFYALQDTKTPVRIGIDM